MLLKELGVSVSSKSIIYGVAILSILIIVGGISWTILKNNPSSTPENEASPNPKSTNNPDNSPTDDTSPILPSNDNSSDTELPESIEQIRDVVMNYIQVNHPETAPMMSSLSWMGGAQPTTVVNTESYTYNS